ncbi:hypothetical protein DL93DRAFT_1169295 [Clavulina sp. PMI_390]|nr:hypothetical protein DL93DRAFT_1169295 [Clavulina sp. PMI_390]
MSGTSPQTTPTPRPTVLIVRVPFERPQDGGWADPVPVNWTPEKERLFWQELSATRANDVDCECRSFLSSVLWPFAQAQF